MNIYPGNHDERNRKSHSRLGPIMYITTMLLLTFLLIIHVVRWLPVESHLIEVLCLTLTSILIIL